jgi:hypothetical protein
MLLLIAYLFSQDNSSHANFPLHLGPRTPTPSCAARHKLADVSVLCYTFGEKRAVYATLGGSFRGVRTEPSVNDSYGRKTL